MPYSLYRGDVPKTVDDWLDKKRLRDNTGGLWRIHDSLYDFTEFVDSHPGGPQWIFSSKGTDITEAFETHHLKGIAETLLPNYFVRKATDPRNQHFTFKEDGFYKTLKAKIVPKLLDIPQDVRKKSDRVTDSLLLSVLLLCLTNCWAWKISSVLGFFSMILNSLVLNFLITSTHSYFHRADNWRMYLFNLNGQSFQDWRVSHSLSHHLFTNTAQDAEIILLEPFLQLLPYKDKPLWARLAAFYLPFVGTILFVRPVWRLFTSSKKTSDEYKVKWTQLIQFFLPLWMYIFGGKSFLFTMALWIATSFFSSFFFIFFGLTAGHQGPDNFFEGDVPSYKEQSVDWGIHQLNTTMERTDYTGSHFKSMALFGDHILHHLFPTLDQAELEYLQPILLEHCNEFGIELRTATFYKASLNVFKQILRSGLDHSLELRKK